MVVIQWTFDGHWDVGRVMIRLSFNVHSIDIRWSLGCWDVGDLVVIQWTFDGHWDVGRLVI